MAPDDGLEPPNAESESAVLPIRLIRYKRKNLNTASGPYALAFALVTGLRVSGLFFGLLETLFRLAGVDGFEPSIQESKSWALPLRNTPIYTRHIFSVELPIVRFAKCRKVGLEPTTHSTCICCMCLMVRSDGLEPPTLCFT